MNATGCSRLTEREKAIVRLAWGGLTHKESAKLLGISHQTVKNHWSNIFNKLHLYGAGDKRTAAAVLLWRAEAPPPPA
jgi:DNA-binding NarL/FixJ family response regulator